MNKFPRFGCSHIIILILDGSHLKHRLFHLKLSGEGETPPKASVEEEHRVNKLNISINKTRSLMMVMRWYSFLVRFASDGMKCNAMENTAIQRKKNNQHMYVYVTVSIHFLYNFTGRTHKSSILLHYQFTALQL